MSQEIKPHLLSNDFAQRPTFPDPYQSWRKMLVFGAVVGAVAALLAAGWDFAQLAARAHGVPSRRTLNALFPYATLGVAAFEWMSVWALTAFSPVVEPGSDPASRRGAMRTWIYWRSVSLRLLVTGLFVILSLELWGLLGNGLRPAFNNRGLALATQASDAAVTILLWMHLRSLAVRQGFVGLAWRSLLVMSGRGGTQIFLFVLPLLLAIVGHSPRLSWEMINIRYSLAVSWDVIAVVVLIEFAVAKG